MLTEAQGRQVLHKVFSAAGYQIAEHVPFPIASGTIHLDGFDAVRRVGYEYISTEDGDRDEITPEVMAELDRGNAAGDFHVLLVDEKDVESAEELEAASQAFLQRAAG